MNRNTVHFPMAQTDEWLDHLREVNRKDNTIRTHRNNVRRCLLFLHADFRSTDAFDIAVEDFNYLWRAIPVKEGVRIAYLRSLSGMVEYHTGVNLLKRTEILRNRDSRDRVFIRDGKFRKAYAVADPLQRLVLCLEAYMGLRRCEMHAIRDGDIDRGVLTIHGKGYGAEGHRGSRSRTRERCAVVTLHCRNSNSCYDRSSDSEIRALNYKEGQTTRLTSFRFIFSSPNQ